VVIENQVSESNILVALKFRGSGMTAQAFLEECSPHRITRWSYAQQRAVNWLFQLSQQLGAFLLN
jgi:hypothetical protein